MQEQISEGERARRQHAALAEQYGPIGPAAILAAVLCAAKKLDKVEQPAKKAA